MHYNLTDSIQFYQAVYKMHPKFSVKSETQNVAGFIKTPF